MSLGCVRLVACLLGSLILVAGVPAAERSPAELRALLRETRSRLRRDPGNEALWTTHGLAAWKLGMSGRAEAAWRRAAALAPGGRAAGFLAELANRRAGRPVIRDLAEYLRILEFQADFRRQAEVERAVAEARAVRGQPVVLEGVGSVHVLFELAFRRHLVRFGGPPSGRGTYLTDALGGVRSTEFGSHRDRTRAPAVLREDAGYAVPPDLVVEAVASGQPAAIEFGLAQLDAADFRRRAEDLASLVARLDDPWARDVLLARLEDLAIQEAPAVLPTFEDFLLHTTRGTEVEARWLALGLLRRAGSRRIPAISLGELDLILVAHRDGLVPLESVEAALEAHREDAELYLLSRLGRGGDRLVLPILALLPRFGGLRTVRSLVGSLARGHRIWRFLDGKAYEVLERIAGSKVARTPEAWKTWLEANG